MKWWLGAGLLLLAALILQSGLLAYAMYVLLAVMLVSRVLARSWVKNVHATREFLEPTAEIGDSMRVLVRVKNSGFLPIPWILLEDLLPRPALTQRPPRLKVRGKRIQPLLWPGGKSASNTISIADARLPPGRSAVARERRPLRFAPPLSH